MLCVSVMFSEEQKETDAHLSIASVRYVGWTGPVYEQRVSMGAHRKTDILIWWSGLLFCTCLFGSLLLLGKQCLDALHPENWACRKRARICPQNPQCGSKYLRLWLSHCMRHLHKGTAWHDWQKPICLDKALGWYFSLKKFNSICELKGKFLCWVILDCTSYFSFYSGIMSHDKGSATSVLVASTFRTMSGFQVARKMKIW